MQDLSAVAVAWGGSDGDGKKFPMFTMPLGNFLQMTKLQKHEELIDSGALCQFEENMGRAMFVSHQWICRYHPDPSFRQLETLQTALKGLLAGSTHVSLPPAMEIWVGRLRCPTASDFRAEALHLWYDYFSCPQGMSFHAARNRELAIGCIPSYVARSFFFVILCPAVQHTDGHTLSESTWARRGWCRLERMARELARDDGFIITIQTASHPTLAWNMNEVIQAPGNGEFSFEEDRARVGQVILRMVWNKLQNLVATGDVHGYRFLLNLHHLHFEGVPGLDRILGLVPGFETDIDPVDHPGQFLIARFLHDNLFKRISDRDSAGWSPLCFAVVKGDAALVKAMLDSRADPNDKLPRKKNDLPKGTPVLTLATVYQNNEVVKVLLAGRANVNARCVYRATALVGAASSDNAAAVRILCEAKADVLLKAFPDSSPFRVACSQGSVKAMKEILINFPAVSLRFCLHCALVFFGDGDTVSALIDASANIDEQLRIPMSRFNWWGLLKALHARHYISPSSLTYLAYHHYGATPLMLSILSGKLEATAILLQAGANMNIQNDRGKRCSCQCSHCVLAKLGVQKMMRTMTLFPFDEKRDVLLALQSCGEF
eukprot:Skav222757  [mRNA]  locus=scaffold600:111323:113131:+ [translate_table: standard]